MSSDKPEKKTRAKKEPKAPKEPKAKKAKEPEIDEDEADFLDMMNDKLLIYIKAELDALDPKGCDRAWEKLMKDIRLACEEDIAVDQEAEKKSS